MYILSEQAKTVHFCGITEFVSEVAVSDGEQIIYIHVHYGTDCIDYLASHISIIEEMEKESVNMKDVFEHFETFSEFEQTKTSKYAKYYEIAERMIGELADSYYKN